MQFAMYIYNIYIVIENCILFGLYVGQREIKFVCIWSDFFFLVCGTFLHLCFFLVDFYLLCSLRIFAYCDLHYFDLYIETLFFDYYSHFVVVIELNYFAQYS